MSDSDADRVVLHGSCVAVGNNSVLLVGASGTGKSATALQMVALGAALVADDQVILTRSGEQIKAACPKGFEGKIEARGIGILDVASTTGAAVTLVVDLDQTELLRLPPPRKREILGLEIDLIYGRENRLLPAGIMAKLSVGDGLSS